MTAVNHKTRASAFGTLATYAGALPVEGAGEAPGATVPQISWIGKSGNWDTTADWSGGALPNAQDQVTINTTAAATVTYSTGSSAIQSLTTGGEDTLEVTGGTLVVGGGGLALEGTLDMAGGTFAIDGDSDIGTINQSGGVLDLGGQGLTLYYGDTFDQTGGTIDVVSGSLYFYASLGSVIDGTVTGNDLDLYGFYGTLGSAADITTASLELHAGTLTVLSNLSYAGAFSSSGTFFLGSNTLSLLGASTLGGVFSGAGDVILGATAQGSFTLGNLETLSNTGTFLQTGEVSLCETQTDSCSISNSAGADWVLASGSEIQGYYDSSNSVSNAGTMEFQFSPFAGYGGDITIDVATFTSTGSLKIDAGASVLISSSSASLAGDVTGNGTLSLSGTTTLTPGLLLDPSELVLTDAHVTLGSALTYSGALEAESGTFALAGNTLTLDGTSTLAGGDDFNGAGAVVLAGVTTVLAGNGEVESGATITNTGTLGGDGYLVAPLISTKLISLSSGNTLYLEGASADLSGAVTGAGTLVLGASGGSTLAAGLKLSVANLVVEDSTTTLAENLVYAGTLSVEGTLALSGHSFSASGFELLSGTIEGNGSIKTFGNALLAGSLNVIDNAILTNTQTMATSGFSSDVTVGSGSTDKATLVNSSTGTMNLGDSYISAAGTGDSFSNAGLVLGDSAQFNITVSNTGTIVAQQGSMSFVSVTGSGTIAADAGASLHFTGSTSGGIIALGAGTSLSVYQTENGKQVVFGDVITGFSLGDIITIGNMEYDPSATLSFNSSTEILTVTGYSSSEKLHLAGSYTSSSFNLFEDNGSIAISHS